ncbi:hypothetical protein FA10DRAFT_304486 [Acaromyces ingoldii]|uniref:Uncharacterized protein n=1 Tax=Acaromyces ingoldii TaxID=215250 RepID=A0A316YEK3_9BASI|nr:hypothetical protein FA10DRAFT_304486 [Acaromyces ingoldii]PWN87078.1 hypothetical protein FA10DRAFT_304486 [Acaromyces ingoldii]
MAGRAKLEEALSEHEPLFKLPGSVTYVGGTGGTATLGPDGVLPWGSWRKPPRRAPRAAGFNHTYELIQQGLTVDVMCWPPRTERERSILTVALTETPHLARVTLQCNVDGGNGKDISYQYVGSNSIVVRGCSNKDADGRDDPDTTVMYFKDAGAELFASVSELGGDLICSLRPRWTSNLVQYVSNRRWINVTELREGRPNRLSGYDGELGPGNHSFSPTSEVSKRDFFAYYARLLIVQNPLAAVGHAFVYSSTLSSVINATKRTSPQDTSSLQSPNTNLTSPANLWGTVLYGKTGAIQSLANFNARMNARRATTWIQPDQVAQFIQGVFEYSATSQREWFQAMAVESGRGGGFHGPISEQNGTRRVFGLWHGATVGWGSSTQESTNTIGYLSLLPIVLFALASWALIGWTHWIDDPPDGLNAAIDPTDWMSAVIAASQGGLRYAFDKNALMTTKGMKGAR